MAERVSSSAPQVRDDLPPDGVLGEARPAERESPLHTEQLLWLASPVTADLLRQVRQRARSQMGLYARCGPLNSGSQRTDSAGSSYRDVAIRGEVKAAPSATAGRLVIGQ